MQHIANSPVAITVSTTALLISPGHPERCQITLVNTGAVNVSVGLGGVPVYGAGIVLMANGGSWMMDAGNYYAGDIYAISTGAGTTVAVQEVNKLG